MLCHVCRDAAVGRCPACGLYYCAEHGRGLCSDCVAEHVQARPRVRVRRVAPSAVAPGKAPDAQPRGVGVCGRCGGPAKAVCPLCHQLYCEAHGGEREVAIGDCTMKQMVCARCSGPRWPVLAWLLLGLALALTCFWLA
ncbi:MAG: hypothetical protein L0Z62_37345 [Gemmataceae bacterium]|nr:hypothetical protein [Gemmataceae bacterium]